MAKKRKLDGSAGKDPSTASATLVDSSAPVDPALASLFANSSGPVTIRVAPQEPSKGKRSQTDKATKNGDGQVAQASIANSNTSNNSSDNTSDEGSSSSLPSHQQNVEAPLKRRRKARPADDIEGDYMKKLANEEAANHQRHKHSREDRDNHHDALDSTHQSENVETRDRSDSPVPQHETTVDTSAETSNCTVFLSNVSTQAITQKASRKTLLRHLSSPLPPEHKLLSLRFRSTPLDPTAGPRRAAFATKKLMDATAHSTNAYVVYSSPEAAETAVVALNASIVLDRHMHADLVDNPAPVETRKCVFVGNLGFVDEETTDPDPHPGRDNNDRPKRPKGKLPADAEEGLWRTFGTMGAVQSVRVVRDPKTRVGKGFAYVQFRDEASVEVALGLEGKKFPPMLPRVLRVKRARKGALRAGEKRKKMAVGGEGGGGPVVAQRGTVGGRERVLFEGHRATAKDRLAGAGKRKRHAKKPTTRSSRRGAAFKAAGGEKWKAKKT